MQDLPRDEDTLRCRRFTDGGIHFYFSCYDEFTSRRATPCATAEEARSHRDGHDYASDNIHALSSADACRPRHDAFLSFSAFSLVRGLAASARASPFIGPYSRSTFFAVIYYSTTTRSFAMITISAPYSLFRACNNTMRFISWPLYCLIAECRH